MKEIENITMMLEDRLTAYPFVDVPDALDAVEHLGNEEFLEGKVHKPSIVLQLLQRLSNRTEELVAFRNTVFREYYLKEQAERRAFTEELLEIIQLLRELFGEREDSLGFLFEDGEVNGDLWREYCVVIQRGIQRAIE